MNFLTQASINTFFVAMGVTFISFIIALPLALLFVRFHFRVKSLFFKLWSLFFSIPSYILAMSWITAANPDVGWIQKFLGLTSLNIYGMWGIIFVEASFLGAFLFLNFSEHLKNIPQSFEEASQISGASYFFYFRKVLFPLLVPKFVPSLGVVFLSAAASYGVPVLLGTPARFYVFTTALSSLLKNGDQNSLEKAFYFSLAFGAIALLLLFIFNKGTQIFWGRKYFLDSKNTKGAFPKNPDPILKWTLNSLFLIVLFLSFIGPFCVLMICSVQLIPGLFSLNNFSFKPWQRVFFESPGFWNAFGNSILAAMVTAGFLVLLILSFESLKLFSAIYTAQAKPSQKMNWIFRAISKTGTLFQALPGSVVALIALFAINKFHFFALTDTLFSLILVYSLKSYAFAESQITPVFSTLNRDLIYSARICGASKYRIMQTILFPIARPYFILAFVFTFLPALTELTMTSLVAGPRSQTLGIYIFELQEYSDKASASVVGVFLILLFLGTRLFIRRRNAIS